MFPEFEAGIPMPPQLQRNRDISRQRNYTITDLLLENRIVFLGTVGNQIVPPIIDDTLANATIQQLLLLQYENKSQEIHFYINSPGGSVTSTLAIYDTMKFMECPISTYCVGSAYSGAAVILAAGTKGKRYALPHARMMLHQPLGRYGGQATDVEIFMNEMVSLKDALNTILSECTGRTIEEIEHETERDRYFNAEAAKEFGLVDEVLAKPQA